ncbi:MAG: methyl-accepting chemotaxis protein [Candidatus Omnitrophica bacterium]|nr:methyl-accepting chemotaxis protein [Candidatus Omnitrophota bacterium]
MDAKIRRGHYLIDKNFQIGFIIRFCGIVITTSLGIGILVFYLTQNSTTVAIENTKVIVKSTADFILPVLTLTVVVITFFSSLVLSLMALIISHRIVGPLYRLRKEIDMLKEGDFTAQFRVRNKDNLKDLASSLSDMSGTLRKRHVELKRRSDQLKEFLKERNYNVPFEDKEKFSLMLEGIDQVLNFFKV